MANETEYILFLDETDTNANNEYFCLSGFAIERQKYEESLIPQINDLKSDILNLPHVVFHYRDMKQQISDFAILKDRALRDRFWRALCGILSSIDFVTFGAYIDAKEYRKYYPKSIALSEYNVLFYEVINSFINFLISNKGVGTIILESRNPQQNRDTQILYSKMNKYGSNIYLPQTIQDRVSTLNFNIKKDNSIGLQIADMIPLVFIRNMHGQTNPYSLYNVFSSKLYKAHKNSSSSYGLVKILR